MENMNTRIAEGAAAAGASTRTTSTDAVSEGATIECTLGTNISILRVPDFHGVSTQGRNEANISDHIPNHNIFSFTMCMRSIPPVPCTPNVIIKWLKGHPNYTLNYDLALLERCIVPCTHGGIISIRQCGQDI